MEEISNEVLPLAQQLDLEIDTEDIDQPVQNLAEELAIEDFMEVEAQKIAEEQETEKQPTKATGPRRICRIFLKVKKRKIVPFYNMMTCRGSGGVGPVVLIPSTTLR